MTRNEFLILSYLERTHQKQSQRLIAKNIGISVGTVNRILYRFLEKGLISDSLEVTEKGYSELEPYRAKRVIFLAAGVGARLLPLTLNTPKPLIRVNGVRIIDTAIEAALAAGIEEIYIVRGHLGEQFEQLLSKYPQIQFLNNLEYNETNNISSAMCARNLLENAYVMEADLIINNCNVIRKYNYSSNCLGVPVEKTDDWCIMSNKGVATRLTLGGRNCHHLFSVYYWNADDGKRLSEHIERVYYSPGGKERFWDLTPLGYFSKEYRVEIIECAMEDITEIDTIRELQSVDRAYALY